MNINNNNDIIGINSNYIGDNVDAITERSNLQRNVEELVQLVEELQMKTMNVENAREYLDLYDTTLNSSPHLRSPSLFLPPSPFSPPHLRSCLLHLSSLSTRTQLGICSSSVPSSIKTLKSWTEKCALPKGLLIGLDVNGRPINTEPWKGSYVKYSTAGAKTFEELRNMGKGFMGLWKNGDAVVEEYEGGWRGVYFSVEVEGIEGGWRQWGVFPEEIWEEET
ncbi:hypothetical protein TrST_g10110 [Triparma strigata]|uniref:Uncharacterized protein n=1 Tax=Triparma strigata TaxID=1606541 RepID=A0A9W7A2I9_9STRA|nr:hypothetical protein TrST_g10110 [Triparma strigata]